MYKRKKFAHVLKKNKTSKFPTQIMFFDCESHAEKEVDKEIPQTFYMGWSCYTDYDIRYKGGYKRIWTFSDKTEKLCKHICDMTRQNRSLYVISANIWFDIRVSNNIPYLIKHKWRVKNYFVNGLSSMFIWTKNDKKIVFLNFQNWFRTSVKVVGKAVGLEKLEVKHGKTGFDEMKKYCRRDVEILVKMWDSWGEFNKKHDFGGFGKTIASQAFNAFRHRFMSHDIYIHNDKKATKIERYAYFGGKTECYFVGKIVKQNVYKIDINSCYPYVMKNNYYPTKLVDKLQSPTVKKLEKLLEKYCVTGRFDLSTQDNAYVVRREKETFYPVGNFSAFLSTGGIKYALKHGHLKSCKFICVYERAKIFVDYVDYLYELKYQYKKEGNKVYYTIVKYFLTNLYGKFGQKFAPCVKEKNIETNIMKTEVFINIDTGQKYRCIQFGGKEEWTRVKNSKIKNKNVPRETSSNDIYNNENEEGMHSFVSIAAHVTEYARIKLYIDAQTIGQENIYYSDTDSFLINEKGLRNAKNLMDSDKLGMYSVEAAATSLEIHALKDYKFGEKVKIKGLTKTAKHIKNNLYEQLQFPGFKSDMENCLKKKYTIKKIPHVLYRKYTKGMIRKDGFVTPHVLEEF